RLVDAVATVALDEIAAAALVAHGPERAVRIDPRARPGDGRLAEIGPEDLDRVGGLTQHLEQGDAERVDLFSRRAAGHPDTNRGPGGLLLDDRGKDLRLQGDEHLGIPKERGDVDENVFVERSDLVGVALEQREVALQSVRTPQRHAAGQATLERGPL